MRNKLLDKISLTLLITLMAVVAYSIIEWRNNAFQKHKSWVWSIDVNQDDMVASTNEHQILLWEKRYCIDSLVGHTDAINSISFSREGDFLVSGSIDKTVKVWSVTHRKIITTLTGHTGGINKVAINSSGNYIVSAGYDNKLFIWDWRNEKRVKEFKVKHTGFSINKSDILAFVDSTCSLRLFDLKSLSNIKVVGQYCGSPTFHPDGKILAIREDSVFQFIDSSTGSFLSELDIKHGTHFEASILTPDGNYLVAGIWGGAIEVWDWSRKKLIKTFEGAQLSSIDDFVFDSKNQLLSASGDRSVKTWDIRSGRMIADIGDGLYEVKLYGYIALIWLATLVISFFGTIASASNKFSSMVVVSILSVWSLGILTLALFIKARLVKYANTLSWVLTLTSVLFVASLYFSWLAFFTVPLSLFLGFVKIQSDREDIMILIPIFLNLILCGILASFIVSAGLWR